MTDGRATWYPEDVRWMAWERTVVLGREFGPAAVSVLAALKAEAKVQNSGWRVKWGYHALDMAAFVGDVATVRAIVSRAAEIGLLDDFEQGEWTFVCRVSGMSDLERRVRHQRAYAARLRRMGGYQVDGEKLAQRVEFYGGLCWICRRRPWEHIDHVKPLAAGGPHILSNLRPACAPCNQSKGAAW